VGNSSHIPVPFKLMKKLTMETKLTDVRNVEKPSY
jgi:hypothetical protein